MEHLDRAAERGMKRTKSFPEEGGHEQAATTEWMDEDSEFGRDQSSGGSGSAGTGVSDRKRKVEAEHPEDVEREYDELSVAEGTQMTAEDNEEDEEARRRKTVIFLKKKKNSTRTWCQRSREFRSMSKSQVKDEEQLDPVFGNASEKNGNALHG